MDKEFRDRVEEMLKKDPRYKADAYEFVIQALAYTQKRFNRSRHVTGRELLEGIKELALEQFGPMAKTVLNHWGIFMTEDFGEIVFNMVDSGLMGKTKDDSKDDFKESYNFDEVFVEKFKEKLNE